MASGDAATQEKYLKVLEETKPSSHQTSHQSSHQSFHPSSHQSSGQNLVDAEKLAKEIGNLDRSPGRPSIDDDQERGEPARQKRPGRIRRHGQQAGKYFTTDIAPARSDLLMFICCIISGFIDSTIYYSFGTFVSMQTGNTIFVGLGGSTPQTIKPYGWAKSLISIACFIIGSFVFSRFHRLLSPLRRSTLLFSFLMQAVCIFLIAGLVESGIINGLISDIPNDIDWEQVVPIGVLSFQSAGQIVASRALGLGEMPSVVVTSVLCDLVSDAHVFGLRNVKRNRRLGGFLGVLIGAVCGGWLTVQTGRIQWSLWVSGALKMVVCVAWAVWMKK